MIKYVKQRCKVKSNSEREVYTGSGYCRRCEYFNGMIGRESMSCKRPDA